jgi:hypothetical protein
MQTEYNNCNKMDEYSNITCMFSCQIKKNCFFLYMGVKIQ